MRADRRCWLAAIVVALGSLAASAAQAATIVVNTLDDPGSPPQCSLRDAIEAAKFEVVVGGCAAGSGSDSIVFQSGLTGTIKLADTLPDINSELSITGPANGGITISGNHAVHVLTINNPGLATVRLSNLTFADAMGGQFANGAIENNGVLTVTNCTFSDNQANNGGAIISTGTLNVIDSTFVGNSALVGGALAATRGASGRALNVTNSTFQGNTASDGGAIFIGGANLNVDSSTFTHNNALGGGAIFSTFAITTLKATILAQSSGGNCAGKIDDDGYNISEDNSCDFTATGSRNDTDPLLDPNGLANNGGPTQTIALQPSSPAIDVVPKDDCPATDQRGFLRPAPGQTDCDVGAFELNAVPAPTIDCSEAEASRPNLVNFPVALVPEQIEGVNDPGGSYTVNITSITQDKPVLGNRFFCQRALGIGTDTARVWANSQGKGGLIYTLGFTATDTGGAGSCSGAVTVCVQDPFHRGKCVDTGKSYDSTRCPR
jgi:CSLREA domain-containing protein